MPHSKIIEQRLRFLKFNNEAVQTLQQVEGLFEGSIDDLLDRFYNHILEQPELKSLFADKESAERARDAQKQHWQRILFSKNFGETQFDQTKKVGQTHLKVSLEPSWYMSAYCFMLNEFIELIAKQYKDDTESLTNIIQALNKAVVLDMSFVIESYFDAKNSSMREILRRATCFTDDIKHLAEDLTHSTLNLSTQTKSLIADSGKAKMESNESTADQTNINDLLKYSDKLTEQVEQLNSRLDKLQTKDRLYIDERRTIGIFTRLKNLFVGR
jgi:hemoglobin-like flavoprotein